MPFPFVDAPRVRERPAMVIARQRPADTIDLLWVLMITSAANKGWRGDISIEDGYAECGLKVPCIVRTAKIAMIETARASRAGALPVGLCDAVRAKLADSLGI